MDDIQLQIEQQKTFIRLVNIESSANGSYKQFIKDSGNQ